LRSIGTPGGLDAREDEGGRLDERDPRRQALVFDERERLDALGSGQFVDESRHELLGATGIDRWVTGVARSRPGVRQA
jgi:hypothetical protein